MTTKRILDIAASAFLLLLLIPVVIAISIAIAVNMGTPVMFYQMRPGRRRKPLRMLKFRTMTDARDIDGELLPDDERLTRLGRFLRDTSLDELPQLINVFLGDMSLIGPRPLLERYVSNCTSEQSRRFDVRPGITGWAQIHGRKALNYEKRFEYDVWYVDHQSLLLDINILLATCKIVLKRDGTVETGEVAPAASSSRMGLQVGYAQPNAPDTATPRTSEFNPAESSQVR
jgi:sugar transferase EpsL